VCVQVGSFHGRNFHCVFFSLFSDLFLGVFGQGSEEFLRVVRFVFLFTESSLVRFRQRGTIFIFWFCVFFVRSLVRIIHLDECLFFFHEDVACLSLSDGCINSSSLEFTTSPASSNCSLLRSFLLIHRWIDSDS
jgi:hypothetical protein